MGTQLRRLWQGWKRLGRKIGDFQARVLLTIFYFVILAPFALVMRLADPLGLKRPGGWHVRPPATGAALARPTVDAALAQARRQF